MNIHHTGGIFSDNAPFYWSRNLPAMPLIPGQKRPAVAGWQLFADRQPTDEEKGAWMRVYPEGNIGMAMGQASGLIAVDIDTDDPKIIAILDRLLPPSPWHRVGAKGMVRIFKFSGERTTRIQSPEGMICEILSKGTQIVLPPSIHPNTKKPYTANANLYDVLPMIPKLIPGIEDMIREELIEAGYDVGKGGSAHKTMDFVPAGARDNKLTAMAGLLARAVVRGERTLNDALAEIALWVEEKVEQVVGDPVTVEKAQKKLIEFVNRDVHGGRKMALPSGWDDGLNAGDAEKLGLDINEDDEKWSITRLIQQMAYDFQQNPDLQSEALHACIQKNLQRLARSEGEINDLDEGRFLKFVATQSGGTVTLSDLRKQLKALRLGDIEGENHDEIARAVHEHINQFGELRYHASSFWQWTGAHWAEKPEFEIMQTISSEFGFYPSCRKTSDYSGILKLMKSKCAKDLQQIFVKGVNFANGFLDEELMLRDHHPDYGCTYVLPYRYLPDEAGKMPVFNQFLLDSWGHDLDFDEKVSAFQEMIGATLFGVATNYQKAFCLYGAAGAGKSVASEIVQGLLPEGSISNIPPEKWNDTFLPAQMYGKLMNCAGELSETKKIAGETYKVIVGGEPITAQHKNKSPFVFRPTCAQWFASNHLPRTNDDSEGFNRRWLFIEWKRPVPVEARTINLAESILSTERAAIAAWAVEGYARLKTNNGYTVPASHQHIETRMAKENNPVMAFLMDHLNLVVGSAAVAEAGLRDASLHELHTAFWEFCLVTGRRNALDTAAFRNGLAAIGNRFGFQIEPRGAQLPEIVRGIALIA